MIFKRNTGSIKVIISVIILLHFFIFSPQSVYAQYNLDMTRETVLFSAGAALYGANFFVRGVFPADSAEEYGSENLVKEDINVFDRWAVRPYSGTISNISDVTLGINLLIPLLLTFDETLGDTTVYLIMYAETMLMSQSFKELVKSTIPRYRPYNYCDNPDIELGQSLESAESFFSGHTAIAFTAASFLSTVYAKIHPEGPVKYLVGAAAYSSAAATGALRIAAGVHFPTDVLAGALWGTFIGIFIPAIHEINENYERKTDLMIYPAGAGGLGMKISF